MTAEAPRTPAEIAVAREMVEQLRAVLAEFGAIGWPLDTFQASAALVALFLDAALARHALQTAALSEVMCR